MVAAVGQVRVSDVEPLASAGSPSGRWALYDDARKQLTTVTEDDTYSVWLESGPHCSQSLSNDSL